MTGLLDVNALLALCLQRHGDHRRVAAWLQSTDPSSFATCSIAELGIVRVLSPPGAYAIPVQQALPLLRLKLRPDLEHKFLPDINDIAQLPTWVIGPKQVTDGHLVQLAATHGCTLATLDQCIPGAFLIPRLPVSGHS